jgi:hypothetical protein
MGRLIRQRMAKTPLALFFAYKMWVSEGLCGFFIEARGRTPLRTQFLKDPKM